jgi:hypothetical protein
VRRWPSSGATARTDAGPPGGLSQSGFQTAAAAITGASSAVQVDHKLVIQRYVQTNVPDDGPRPSAVQTENGGHMGGDLAGGDARLGQLDHG